MAFHSVLVIEYNGTPTTDVPAESVVTKTIRNKITDLAKQIVWSTARYFNAVVNFLSRRPYNPSDIPEEVSSSTSGQSNNQSVPIDRAVLEKELRTAARYFTSVHKQNLLTRRGPPGSRPGQYPRYRTTTLAKSITFRVDASNLNARIGYKDTFGPTGNPVFYSQLLVDSGRKSIPDTIKSLQPLKTQSGYLLQWKYDSEGYF